MSVVADAYLRMERCNCISPRRRDGVTRSNRPWLGTSRTSKQARPAASNTASRVRTDRALGGVLPDDRLLIQSVRAFCCCTVRIVVIDAEKIDQSWSTDTLSRR